VPADCAIPPVTFATTPLPLAVTFPVRDAARHGRVGTPPNLRDVGRAGGARAGAIVPDCCIRPPRCADRAVVPLHPARQWHSPAGVDVAQALATKRLPVPSPS
jgi:hypothetical protein